MNNLKEELIKILEEHRQICCDGTTAMVMECLCEYLCYVTGLLIRWQGRTIYLKENGLYKKLATIKVYKEKLAKGEGSISSVDSYKLFI